MTLPYNKHIRSIRPSVRIYTISLHRAQLLRVRRVNTSCKNYEFMFEVAQTRASARNTRTCQLSYLVIPFWAIQTRVVPKARGRPIMLETKDFLSDCNSVQILEVKSLIDHLIALGRFTNYLTLENRVSKLLSKGICKVEKVLCIYGGLNATYSFVIKELIQLL